MAHIWMDDENAGANVLLRSNRKAMHMPLGMGDNASARKSVLSKLDNVIYNNNNNRSNITPFKGANQMWPMSCAPKLSLCKETLQKQHRKQHNKDALHLIDGQPKVEAVAVNNLYAKSADPNDSFDLFDFMDFPSQKCLNNCHKSMSQDWSEPLLSDDLIEKLLNHSGDSEEETLNDDDLFAYQDLDTLDSELEPLKYINNDKENLADILEVSLPMPIEFDPDLDVF
ncbi:hypothetical protein ACLKA6_007013 [Drosophila palustris]